MRLEWFPARKGTRSKALLAAQGRPRAAGLAAWDPAFPRPPGVPRRAGQVWKWPFCARTLACWPSVAEAPRSGPRDVGTWAFPHSRFCPATVASQGSKLGQAAGCRGECPAWAYPGRSAWEAGWGTRIWRFSPAAAKALVSFLSATMTHRPRSAHGPGVFLRAPAASVTRPLLAESGQDRWGLGPQPLRGWQCAASGDLEDDHLSFN